MHHLNSALTTACLYAASRARKMRSDQGMSTIEYALGQYLHQLGAIAPPDKLHRLGDNAGSHRVAISPR